ncbi:MULTISPECIES: translation elongation factor Ts [Caproicibacterium]|jgi:elongation factor Ts|uniref:Elongation factor Ts n=1 Tax=Caproicibacterium lactatifermentans TaxID=2666138 RepID=A0A859DSH0_9FIRM|nr:translation elongation factor Ts [Caproicibacterium lactatifermentans]QKN24419.1 elongation factor Ts [Caproicibacterium lactatifermentans]QKO30568.1 elongation factor Ts [Caproicibacterium lactatifermentans]
MAFTAKDVKELRDKTGCGMMDCKKALTASDGDMEKALDFLREKGLATASKKADRVAAEGMAFAKASADGKTGVAVEVNAETDFVAKNASFQEFVNICADTILKENPADVDALMKCKAAGSDQTVDEILKEKILTIGENIKVRRFVRMEGHVASYIHAGGKICVLVNFDTTDEIAAKPEFAEMGKNIGMQIAAMNPQFLDDAHVPQSVLDREAKIAREQAAESGKPDNVIEKMITGKVKKALKEICLVDQEYVKESKTSVSKYVASVGKTLGGKIAISDFARFVTGEGIEKRKDDLAAEVASMVK